MKTHEALMLPGALLVFGPACQSQNDTGTDGWPPTDPVVAPAAQPDISVEPPSIAFGSNVRGCPTDPVTVTVTNVGEAPLEVSDIASKGAGVGTYTYTGPTAGSLTAGQTLTFSVSFEAPGFDSYEGFIEIESNDPDEPLIAVNMTGNGSENPANEDVFVQHVAEDVDVLWVVDNSGSMGAIIGDLINELPSFINTFTTLGVDYQLGVTTTDMESDGHKGLLQGAGVLSPAIQGSNDAVMAAFNVAVDDAFATGGSTVERGRDGAYAALTPPLINNENAGMLRSNSHLAVIVISDEEDQSSDISDGLFISWLDGLKGDPDTTSFSAMAGEEQSSATSVGFGQSCTFGGSVSGVEGSYYYPHVSHATGGLYTDMCNADFAEVLVDLAYNAAGLTGKFCLSDTPATGVAGMKVVVDGTDQGFPNPNNGWWYDSAANCVTFFGDSFPGPNAPVAITYPTSATCD